MSDAVPVINLSRYLSGDDQGKASVAREVAGACESIGFFKIANHGVPQALIDDAFATAGAFFAQPAAVKDSFRPPRSAYNSCAGSTKSNPAPRPPRPGRTTFRRDCQRWTPRHRLLQ